MERIGIFGAGTWGLALARMLYNNADARKTIWQMLLPELLIEDAWKDLADKFDLSGSNIKAILFNAAYMAGAEKSEIEMRHIVRAMEYEFNKLGKLVNNSDFGDHKKYLLVQN